VSKAFDDLCEEIAQHDFPTPEKVDDLLTPMLNELVAALSRALEEFERQRKLALVDRAVQSVGHPLDRIITDLSSSLAKWGDEQ